ncbi:MAG: aldolase/citrate lyase family protein [Candidatus Poribacteria bacterium]|nr:aldolase/citrate lyase family protein [Candidatus Poribacteria bacterium]
MNIRTNKLKQKLKARELVFSGSVRLPEPGLVEVMGYAGVDYVLIDAEHGSIGWTEMERMILGAYAADVTPIVRIHENNEAMIMRALDIGAMGVLVPHCRNAADAQRVVDGALYPPQGKRGVGPSRGIKFGAVPVADYYAGINNEISVSVMIEDAEAIDSIDEIVEVDGIDVLNVGTSDLAASLGVPGQPLHAKVAEASEKVLVAANRKGIAVGYPTRSIEDGLQAIKRGFRVLSCGNAGPLLFQAVQGYLEALRSGS